MSSDHSGSPRSPGDCPVQPARVNYPSYKVTLRHLGQQTEAAYLDVQVDGFEVQRTTAAQIIAVGEQLYAITDAKAFLRKDWNPRTTASQCSSPSDTDGEPDAPDLSQLELASEEKEPAAHIDDRLDFNLVHLSHPRQAHYDAYTGFALISINFRGGSKALRLLAIEHLSKHIGLYIPTTDDALGGRGPLDFVAGCGSAGLPEGFPVAPTEHNNHAGEVYWSVPRIPTVVGGLGSVVWDVDGKCMLGMLYDAGYPFGSISFDCRLVPGWRLVREIEEHFDGWKSGLGDEARNVSWFSRGQWIGHLLDLYEHWKGLEQVAEARKAQKPGGGLSLPGQSVDGEVDAEVTDLEH